MQAKPSTDSKFMVAIIEVHYPDWPEYKWQEIWSTDRHESSLEDCLKYFSGCCRNEGPERYEGIPAPVGKKYRMTFTVR